MTRALAGDDAQVAWPATRGLGAALNRRWRSARHVASETVVAMRISRMASALNQLNDDQLARIGVARHEIWNHAETLVVDQRRDRDGRSAM